MTGYLLDTDTAIELLRARNSNVERRLAAADPRSISISSVTVAELFFGALRSREPQRSCALCRDFCSAFRTLPLDAAAAEESSIIRADLEGRGERIRSYDVLIAGIAVASTGAFEA